VQHLSKAFDIVLQPTESYYAAAGDDLSIWLKKTLVPKNSVCWNYRFVA